MSAHADTGIGPKLSPELSWTSVRGADGRQRMEMRWTLQPVVRVPESPAELLAAAS